MNCAHLHCHSRYSFKDGQDPVEDLVARAAELGQPGIALTDHGVLFGAPDLFKACAQHDIKGVIGMEGYEAAVPWDFDLERDSAIFKVKWADLQPGQDRYYHLTLWVLDRRGWENICALHSQAWSPDHYPTVRGKPLIDRAMLAQHNEGLAIGLGCIASRTSVMLARHTDWHPAYEAASFYVDTFGADRVFMEVQGNTTDQQALISAQRKLAKRLGVESVATNDVHYVRRTSGVQHGSHHILVQSRRFKKADTEEATDKSDDGFGQWYGSDGFYLKSADEMLQTGGLLPDEIERTLQVLDLVDFNFQSLPEPRPPIIAAPAPGVDKGFDSWLAMR
jgi:DNA polymerase III subunit alpha